MHVAFMCFIVHVHVLPFLSVLTIKMNDGSNAFHQAVDFAKLL